MSDGARDPVAMATARLEAAVERLAEAFAQGMGPGMGSGTARDGGTSYLPAEDIDMVPRSEVAAMAERLDATIARLRVALAEELRPDDAPHGEPD